MRRERKLYLTICDYNKNAVCDIYDNQSDISGQATNVFIDTERNGWKELSFDIPSTCFGENGEEENYRLKYLIAEYKIRAITDKETDWYIISEPKINRNGYSKNVSVRASHISQLLKNKNLDLEFSDEEGNNVGTAEALLTTILEGSGWNVGYVETFTEDDGTIKQRSLVGQAGTGALGFIDKLCDLFEAKPIYHSDSQTIDIVAMNPFAKIAVEEIPKTLVDNENIIELYYDRNVHSLTKTTNTENMATRLYAYGSSGDQNGACTLQNAEHSEYIFIAPQNGTEFCFEDVVGIRRFFKGNVSVNDKLIWSDLDITSKSYVWNETKRIAYKVNSKPEGNYIELTGADLQIIKNEFPYLLSLKYYDDVGLMTNQQFQDVATFQRDLPLLYKTLREANEAFVEDEFDLSQLAESSTGFLKFKVTRDFTTDDDGAKRIYVDDIIYRTDYDVAERRYFQWHIAKQLKTNGDPVEGTPSFVYIIHNTNPVSWDKIYLKRIYNQSGDLITDSEGNPGDFDYGRTDRPGSVSVWTDEIRYDSNDRFYLFCTNSISGSLGAKQIEDESVVQNLLNTTQDGSEKHTTVFADATDPIPELGSAESGYGWFYKFNKMSQTPGTLYFCWGSKGDHEWHQVYADYTSPSTADNGTYFFNLKYKTLWHRENGQWIKYTSAAEQRVANSFSKVYYYCRRRDMLYKGLYENYLYNASNLPAANYAIPNEFAFYWTFTTDRTVTGQLKLDTIKGYVYQDTDIDHIVTSSVTPYDTVFFPAENELSAMSFDHGTIDLSTGVEEDNNELYRSSSLRVWENTKYQYSFPAKTSVIFYTISMAYISSLALTGNNAGAGNFTTPANTRYVRFVTSSIPNGYLRVDGYNSKFYINDKPYNILSNVIGNGELLGIIPLTQKFADLADKTYEQDLTTAQLAQEEIKTRDNDLVVSLGDMLKDGRWQDSNYIKGDEKRLYDEACNMIKQVSMPEINYSFTYLDMFGVKNEHYYEEHETHWPNIDISYVAHLVDTESNTNCWAYIDKIRDCFDQQWKTTIEVDTKLTLAARHGFTDVIARIAEVAKQINSKQPQYDRAATGSVSAQRLEGTISLFNTMLKGESSNWYTNEKGNIVFESADGLSAMMLSGSGLGIANSKDEYGDWAFRTAATGYGITADEIYTGYLSAERIETGSITAEKLMANVGQELDIGSNKALTLFATVNGSRPAGTVKTTDGLIEIIAGYESGGTTVPAQINVISGGELNLSGGNVNITSSGKLNVASDGEFTLKAKGANSLNSTADGLYIGSDGVNLGGGKFKVSFNSNTSTVNMTAGYVAIGTPGNETTSLTVDNGVGKINIEANNEINITSNKTLKLISNGGNLIIGSGTKPFTIGADGANAFIYNGRSTLATTNVDGIYLGTDGINVGQANSHHVIVNPSAGTVDISGKIIADEGNVGGWYIGNTSNNHIGNASTKNNSTVGMAYISSGTAITFWAGGKYNGTGANEPKFWVKNDGSAKFANATITGGSITLKSSDGTVTYFSASSSGASIKGSLTADSLYVGGNNIISNNKISLTSSTFAGIGTSSSSVQITNNSIVVRSGGTIDLSAASTVNISVGWNQITGKPDVFTVPTGMTIEANHLKIYSGNNYVDITPTLLKAVGSQIKLENSNASNYVHITDSGIDIKGSRITITDATTGETTPVWARDDIVVMNPNAAESWRRTVDSIITHMSGKHDWVLVKPYYNAQILYNITGINKNVTENSTLSLTKLAEEAFGDTASGYSYDLVIVVKRTNANAQPSLFFKVYAKNGSSTRTIVLGSGNFSATGGAEPSIYQTDKYNIQMIRTADGIEKETDYGGYIGNWIFRTTLSAGAGALHNLAGEGYSMFIDIGGTMYGSGFAYVQSVEITANCNAATGHVPCTVYYYT